MRYRFIEREPEAFQQPVGVEAIEAMCRRAFGSRARISQVIELAWGTYNSTYRIEFTDGGDTVLRVAPESGRQYRIDRELMRNEHAGLPFLAPLGHLVPRTLMADFTRQLLDRDYLFQSVLTGVPGPEAMSMFPRPQWAPFFREIGAIARTIHRVRGRRFGAVGGPTFDRWSAALVAYFADAAADLGDAGLDASDVDAISAFIAADRGIFDEITEPRFLHGDLWTANVMVRMGDPHFRITGVCDWDRCWWGDPSADWVIYRALARPGTERDTFWDGYGRPGTTPNQAVRAYIYLARHVVANRLERFRRHQPESLAGTYTEMTEILRQLGV